MILCNISGWKYYTAHYFKSMITVTIKNVKATIPDMTIEMGEFQTIGDLKQILSVVYADNPQVDSQKLVHGGKLLENEITISSLSKVEMN